MYWWAKIYSVFPTLRLAIVASFRARLVILSLLYTRAVKKTENYFNEKILLFVVELNVFNGNLLRACTAIAPFYRKKLTNFTRHTIYFY